MKFNHIAENTLVNLKPSVLFRLGIISFHKDQNFKHFLKIPQFTGEGIKNSSWARLKLFVGHRLPMHAIRK